MKMAEKRERMRELSERRAALVSDIRRLELEISRHVRNSPRRWPLQKRMAGVHIKLAELKNEIYIISNTPVEDPPLRPWKVRPGVLTEHDLHNALVEPQQLLQLAYVALLNATARSGRVERDRAILDAVRDYLQRQGIMV